MRDLHLPGVTLSVVKRGALAHQKAYGLARVDRAAPMAVDTVLPIASVTKVFTALAVLKLVEQGRIKLDEPFATYVRDAPPAWRGITVRELLAMQSGIPQTGRYDPWQTIVKWAASQPLDFPPGASVAYSNTNFLILGALIEEAAAATYDNFLTVNVLTPAGLTSTRLNGTPDTPLFAIGYVWSGGAWQEARYKPPYASFSSGALVSNQLDLVKLDAALASPALLTQASLAAMAEPQKLRSGRVTERGLGWDSVRFHGRARTLSKGGELPGWRCVMVRALDERVTIVLQANLQETRLSDVAAALLDEALRG